MSDTVYISLFDAVPTWVMLVPIFICSILAVAVIIERLVFYRKIDCDYRPIVKRSSEYIQGGASDDVKTLCAGYSGPIVNLIERLVEGRIAGAVDSLMVQDLSRSAIRKIEKYIGLMSTVATVSPMFGLFGTVTGMMKSFSALTKAGQYAHDLLARGIAEALVTTALGLMVAIPAWIFYNYMVTRVDGFIKEVEYVANSLAGPEL